MNLLERGTKWTKREMESFPASDPPSYSPLTGAKKPRIAKTPKSSLSGSLTTSPVVSKGRSGRVLAGFHVAPSAGEGGNDISTMRTISRLIKAAPIDPDVVAAAFESVATTIQARESCDRVTALQHAVDEKPPRAGSQ
jgi:hypothetical protein